MRWTTQEEDEDLRLALDGPDPSWMVQRVPLSRLGRLVAIIIEFCQMPSGDYQVKVTVKRGEEILRTRLHLALVVARTGDEVGAACQTTKGIFEFGIAHINRTRSYRLEPSDTT